MLIGYGFADFATGVCSLLEETKIIQKTSWRGLGCLEKFPLGGDARRSCFGLQQLLDGEVELATVADWDIADVSFKRVGD